MIKKIIALAAFATSGMLIANEIDQLTLDLRKEVESNSKSKVTEETHPILYGMISDLAKEMNIKIPQTRVYKASKSSELNAFIVTGINFTGITSGMAIGEELINVLDYEEIKAFISHEFAHIKQYHIIKKVLLSKLNILITMSIVKKITKDPFVEKLSPIVSIPMALIGNAALSRHFEKEADMIAARYANPKKMASGLKKTAVYASKYKAINKTFDVPKFQITRNFEKFLSSIFSTHPSDKERIKYLNEEAERQEAEFRALEAA